MHRLYLDHPIPQPGETLLVGGEEASHALRVKRLGPGDAVGLLDGAGGRGSGMVTAVERARGKHGEAAVELRVVTSERSDPIRPVLDVRTATPKGGRVDDMVEQLSQVGAASWGPLATERGVVDPRETKLLRLERVARESAKQCGRAWVLRVDAPEVFAAAVAGAGRRTIVADGSGEPWRREMGNVESLRLLIGPEGGWTEDELAAARQAGAVVTRFGPHTMRIETAAVAAAAVIMAGAATAGNVAPK